MRLKITPLIGTAAVLALFGTANAQTPKNCKEILGHDPSAVSGVYTIDPDGAGPVPSMQCQCDMETDGGGWTLVLNYNHLAGTNPALNVFTDELPVQGAVTLGTDESGTQYWGHAGNATLSALVFDELRFYGITSNHARVMHFKTQHTGTIDYFRSGTGSTSGISSAFTPLPDHTAFLPGAINNTNSNAGNLAMTEYPLWTGNSYHWFLSPGFGRWEMDDYNFSLPSTLHQIWTRECVSYSLTEVSACESYQSPSGLYTWTESGIYMDTILNVGGCDSVMTIDLTIDELPLVTVTENGASLTVDQTLDSYQWVDCDNANAPVPSATDQTFAPAVSGNYAVEAASGACVVTSNCYQVITVGVRDLASSSIVLNPNPTTGLFTVRSEVPFNGANVSVYDLNGRVVLALSNQTGSSIVIDATEFPEGVYLCRIMENGQLHQFKLVKE